MTDRRDRQRAATTARMRARFHAEPIVQATELLLQERTPRDVAGRASAGRGGRRRAADVRELAPPGGAALRSPHDATPRTHLLSNGRYTVMLTAAGSGYSRWRDLAVTRWREDATRDDWGTYVFLRDVQSGAVWSAGYQPCGVEPEQLRGRRSPRTAPSSSGATASLTTTLEVVVSPEDDAEVRRVSLDEPRAAARARSSSPPTPSSCWRRRPPTPRIPAFSKLFVQTEYLAEHRRAPRDAAAAARPTSPTIWAAHLAVVEGETVRRAGRSRPTARASSAAAARSRTPAAVMRRPAALRTPPARCSIPIFACAAACAIAAGQRRRASPSGRVVAPSRSDAARPRRQAPRPQRLRARGDAGLDAGAGAAAPSRHRRRARPQPLPAPRRAACSTPTARCGPRPTRSAAARGPQPALWAHGISGDLPIVLRAHRRRRGPRPRPPAAARARVLAHEAARGRSRDPERARRRPTSRTCRSPSRPRCAPASRGRSSARELARGAVLRAARRSHARARRAALLLSRRARRARRPPRHARRAARTGLPPATRLPPPAPGARRAPSPARRAAAAAPTLEFFNGLGGFADGRPRVRDGPRRPAARRRRPGSTSSPIPASASRSSAEGSGYTWSREQPREPADALVERPGHRPARRGALRARRGRAASSGAPTALPIRDDAPRTSPATATATAASSTRAHGIALELAAVRAARRSGQDLAPHAAQPVRSARAGSRSRPTSSGCSAPSRGGVGAARSSPRSTPRPARCSRATPGALAFGARVAFADLGGRQTAWTADRTRVPRPQRHASTARRRSPDAAAAVGRDRRRPRSLRGAADAARARSRARRAEIVFLLGEAARRRSGARADRALPRPPISTRCLRDGRARTGTSCSARSR